MKIIHENIEKDYTMKIKEQIHLGVSHWHQRVELLYVLNGTYQVEISQQHYIGNPGDLFVIHSGEIHRLSSQCDDCAIYVCTFNPMLLQSVKPEISYVQSKIAHSLLQSVDIDLEIKSLFDEIQDEIISANTWHDVIIRANILRIYSLLVRHFEREALPSQKDATKFKFFQEVLSYIADSYADDITLDHVAAKLSYSPAHVSTMFVTYTGMNFKTYLDSIRIHNAAELLKNSAIKASDIASHCGFSNIRTFNNTFRRITGTSPSQFRSNKL